MTHDTESSPACRNCVKAVNEFIAACFNQCALSPIERWRRLHRCVVRHHA